MPGMTIATAVRKVQYAGNGVSDEFPITYEVDDPAHVRVTYTPPAGASVVLTQGTNPGYNVSNPGLNNIKNVYPVTAGVPAVSGSIITIERVVPLTQLLNLDVQGTYDPEAIENELDRLTAADQQIVDRVTALESGGPVGSVVASDGLEFVTLTNLRVKPADGSITSSPAGTAVGVISDAQHGDRAGGSRHAVATGSVAGFQSATDKTRQDALWARTITAGAGLTGGGDLSANRTLAVGAPVDGSILVNADDIQVGVLATDAQHGNRGGGGLHGVATTSVAGFMSAGDKAKLDGLAVQNVTAFGLVSTSDATPTLLGTVTPADNTTEILDVLVVARRKSGSGATGDSAIYRRTLCVRRIDGTTSILGSPVDGGTVESVAGWDVTFTVSSPNVNINAVGAAATLVNWRGQVTRVAVEQA